MFQKNNFLNFETEYITETKVKGIIKLIKESKTYPFLNLNGILYKYKTIEKNKKLHHQLIPLGFACKIKKQIEMLDDNKKFVEFSFFKGNAEISKILQRETLLSKNIPKLYSSGYTYNQTKNLETEVANYLGISEQLAPLAYRHKSVGLIEIEGKKAFALNEMVGHIESEYDGILDLKPCGEYNVWLDLIKTSVIGRTGLEFSLSCSFAAMILNFLPEVNQNESIW
ncbi:DUF927 domain-containing protein [Eubacteriales bacterium OttesenSCG-928-G02]|nr:DUF927 domain-containing protein [Eubacteriales bacterium OttesenSCG-928-G02]